MLCLGGLRTKIIFCILIYMLGVHSAAQAQSGVAEEVFSDWRVMCDGLGEARMCQMFQAGSASEDTPNAFLLSISRDSAAQRDFAVMTVPLGVYLASGVEIRVDGRRPFKVLYEICDRAGCYAGFKLSGAVLTAFQRGLDAKIRVWTARDKAIDFPVSLRGFSKAFAYYQKQGVS